MRSPLDVVAQVIIKIQGTIDTHISQTMFNMLGIKEVLVGKEHKIRRPDSPYDGSGVLKERIRLDDLLSEAMNVRETMISRLEMKRLGGAAMPLGRNGSPGLQAFAIDYMKNFTKAFVKAMVGSASSVPEGGSGGSCSNGSKPPSLDPRSRSGQP